jgi:hypothetical protein
VWSPARQALAAAREATGLELESSHWNWIGKVERVERGELILIAVECEGAVQGLMAIPAQPRPSVLMPGRLVVYVDYLESAPWNLRAPNHPPRFKGAGKALIGQAIHFSEELGLGGRVGLHSLPQAEQFYEATCRMTRFGTDTGYHKLVYFEYDERAGSAWLAAEGTSE